ncbi:MAG TPA: KpsF/GutQ family sugar-phosphate isomerase [Bacillota bacterium]|nr:KpsF/GutQ family sugar-phosphate isomerase [Bacillota bacterium]
MEHIHQYLQQAAEVLENEAEAVRDQIEYLGSDFIKAVDLILNCSGRVVVTGMGKSGHVGRKIAATLASTGTPSFFLHPGEGIHGDLGMVTPADIVMAISNSGEVDEVLALLPSLKVIGVPVIGITESLTSTLAQNCELVLQVKVKCEACPLGLAPTSSTTAVMALGDALAIVLLKARNFSAEDFALYHPGGALGRKLLLTVEKLMYSGVDSPIILQDRTIRDAIIIMTRANYGAVMVIDENGHLTGIVTDGDLKRIIEKYPEPLNVPVDQVMTRNPKTITKEKLAAEAMHMMEAKNITVLPVVDAQGSPEGIIHLHSIIKGLTGLKG